MAHTLDHIVAERLAADPSLAVDHPDYVAPIALGNYELPDFSVPPATAALSFLGSTGLLGRGAGACARAARI